MEKMTGQTITRSQISEAVYQEVGLSRNESAELLESVLTKISNTLAGGESVKISSFGSFSVRSKGRRRCSKAGLTVHRMVKIKTILIDHGALAGTANIFEAA